MNFRDALLGVFGTSRLSYVANFVVICIISLLLLIFPAEHRTALSFGLIIAFAPISLAFLSELRKNFYRNNLNITVDTVLLFLLIMSISYFNQDLFRIGICALTLLLLKQIEYLQYDILNDKLKAIFIKQVITLALAIFISLSLNLAIILYALSKMG